MMTNNNNTDVEMMMARRRYEEQEWVLLLRATMERLERARLVDIGQQVALALRNLETTLAADAAASAAPPAPSSVASRTRGQAQALVEAAEERARRAAMQRRATIRAWGALFDLEESQLTTIITTAAAAVVVDLDSAKALMDEDGYAFEPMCFRSVGRKPRRVIECLDALRQHHDVGAPLLLLQRDCLPLGVQLAPKLREYLLSWP
jgi:hypothetical protein